MVLPKRIKYKKLCWICGAYFLSTHNRSKYCPDHQTNKKKKNENNNKNK